MKIIRHPYIVAIHEIIETAGELYMVMELCRKGTLFRFVGQKCPLEDSKAKQIFMQLV
jgi:5'-AMP-activated protein kinase catalytic alpha subunit